jgi:hypothetical protein
MDENVTEKNSTEFYLSVTACLLIVIALLITLLVEVPIDNQIKPGRLKQFLPIGRRFGRAGRFFTQPEHLLHWEAELV